MAWSDGQEWRPNGQVWRPGGQLGRPDGQECGLSEGGKKAAELESYTQLLSTSCLRNHGT